MSMRSWVLTVVLAVAFAASAVALLANFGAIRRPGNHQGYEPAQPIEYSHRLHAGELQIACLYCHSGAEKSRHAGIPAANVCMNCHKVVTAPLGAVRAEDELAAKEGRAIRKVVSPELAKLLSAVGTGAPIAWTKVHNLPDFVYFNHRAHVAAGVACQQCHGPVETMERVRQVSTLNMGWCVNCHREVSRTGVAGRRVHASIDCATCHF
jgi:hypothetical protein